MKSKTLTKSNSSEKGVAVTTKMLTKGRATTITKKAKKGKAQAVTKQVKMLIKGIANKVTACNYIQ